MTEIRVGFESVSVETNRLADVADTMRERVRAAESSVAELSGEGWSGVAASAFRSAFTGWDDAATDCVSVLSGLVEDLRATVSDFMAREQSNVETAQRLTGNAPPLGIAGILGGE